MTDDLHDPNETGSPNKPDVRVHNTNNTIKRLTIQRDKAREELETAYSTHETELSGLRAQIRTLTNERDTLKVANEGLTLKLANVEKTVQQTEAEKKTRKLVAAKENPKLVEAWDKGILRPLGDFQDEVAYAEYLKVFEENYAPKTSPSGITPPGGRFTGTEPGSVADVNKLYEQLMNLNPMTQQEEYMKLSEKFTEALAASQKG